MTRPLNHTRHSERNWISAATVACLIGVASTLVFFAWELAESTANTILPLAAASAIAVCTAAVTAYATIRQRRVASVGAPIEEAALFRRRMDEIHDGFCIWNPQGKLILWNRRYAEMTGYLDVTLRPGLTFRELILRGSRARQSDLTEAERTTWADQLEVLFRKADGTARAIVTPDGRHIEVVDRRTADGEIVTTLHDRTGEDLALKQLGASEALFRDGIESMADGFMLWDEQDRLVVHNGRAVELLPHLAEMDIVGRTFEDFAREAIALARPDLSDVEREEWLSRRHDRRSRGEHFEVVLSDGRIVQSREQPTSQGGCVTILRDVSEERRAEQATATALAMEREANAQQRRFVSIAGHEFRTPLAIIDSSTQRLETRLGRASDDETRLRLGRIREAIARMSGIIDITLTSARLDAGRITAEIAPFDSAALMREVIARQRSISPRFEIALDVQAPSAEVAGDRALSEQIFTNLISNAAKYSPQADRIEVSIRIEGEQVAFAVRDHGIGIHADDIEKLFTRFFRARTATGIAGTGIGLHLVRELVQLQGGQIDVRSELGKGSTFTVRLPRAQALPEMLSVAS